MSNVHKVSVSWRLSPIYDESEWSFVVHTQCCGSWERVVVREPRKKSVFEIFEDGLRFKCHTCGKSAEISKEDSIRMATKVRGTGDWVERHITEEVDK